MISVITTTRIGTDSRVKQLPFSNDTAALELLVRELESGSLVVSVKPHTVTVAARLGSETISTTFVGTEDTMRSITILASAVAVVHNTHAAEVNATAMEMVPPAVKALLSERTAATVVAGLCGKASVMLGMALILGVPESKLSLMQGMTLAEVITANEVASSYDCLLSDMVAS